MSRYAIRSAIEAKKITNVEYEERGVVLSTADGEVVLPIAWGRQWHPEPNGYVITEPDPAVYMSPETFERLYVRI